MSAKNKPVNNKDSRPTIGVIVDSMISSYQTSLWRSIKTACKERDLNAICFVGREIFIDSDYQFHKQANAIYKLVNKNNLDGLILLTGTISHFVDEVELETYLQKFQPLPMVSIAETVTNIPSIVLDNHAGIHEIVAHLVKEHQYRKIGYVRMREGHAEGNIRFEAFKGALETHNIPYDPELIVPGDYYNQPEAIIQLLYDERKVKPEALVVSDDFMAIPIIEALQNRGIAVPADVAIVGFDDVEEARYIDPPLTTMRQPLWEQAIQAVEIILTALNENTVPQVIEMSPTLIVRQSCGCTPVGILSAAAPILDEAPKAESLSAYKKEILTSLMEFAEFTTEQSVQALVEALIVAVENNASESYLASLTKILRQSETRDEDILGWQIIISALRPFILNILLQSKSALIQAENLLQQSRVMIAETARSYQAKRRLKMQEHNLGLQYLSQALNTTMNFEELLQTLDQGLPGLGVPEFYISVYEQNNPDTEYVRLVLAHTDQETPPLPPGGLRYNAVDLLPSGFRKGNSRGQKFVQPLYFRDEQYGFAIFEDQAYSESLFDTLAQQISSSLKGISLIQQVERRAVQLETAAEVSQAASSILEPEDLIQQSVNLVKDRFDLYYVGLFLADEERHWAELRAGTGEPGEKMLAINWRLEIGGESMIGRCVETGEPDIQLDIDKAPIHLRNPYLPETKSELALPMRSRGEVLGALTIQSASANAFSAEDVSILQTMADQLANAIGNAYLYNALAREQYLMDALMDNMPEAIYFKDKDSKFLRISRFMVNNFGVEKPSEIIGKTDFDFFTPEHAQPAFDNEQEIIKTGEPLLNIEELETWEDRPDTWGMTSKLPLRNERGEIIGTFGITRDITELKTIQIAQENQSKQLQTTIEVSRAISEILDPQELSSQIVNLIKEQFGFYYVGFFEVNEFGDQAVLRSGSGEAGQKMVESNWRLDIDNNSMIGQCMLSGQPNIQLDIDKAPAHLRNPYLPDTKSEMALPLFSRAEVLGALTIQSDKANAFTTEDITVLQTMANQISVALSNAHLFEETQNALMETETLLNVSRLASSSVGIDFAMPQILDLILKSTQIDAGLFSLANRNTKQLELTTSQIPEQLEKTLRQRGFNGTLCDLVYQQKEPIILNDLETYSPIDAQGLIKMGFLSYQGVPIETRGEIYGTLCTFSKFKLRPEDSRINLLQALGQQIGVAIENARLFEQTQAALAETERQASRLFALNEISEKLSQANTLDEIYQAGASQLAQIIAADRISFALLKDDGKNAELLTVSGESGIAPTGSIISLEGSSIEKAIESKRPVIVNNPLPSESEQDDSFAQVGLTCFMIIPLIVGNEAIGSFNFGAKDHDSFSTQDRDLGIQLALLMGNAIENQNLIQQTQAALQQTSDLFLGSERIIRANTVQEILNALVNSTLLQDLDRVGLLLFNRPWDDHSHPDTLSVAANWVQSGLDERAPVGTSYKLEEYPLANILGLKHPVFIRDFNSDESIDTNSRQYFTNVLGVIGAVSLPMVIGNQSLGGIVALSSKELKIAESDIRQVTSLSEQAATVIQSILLNEQTQATLAELEATQRRYQIQAWSSYNQSRTSSGYQKTQDGFKPIGRQTIPEVKDVLEKQTPIINNQGDDTTLTVPIILRDQVIGAIGLEGDENKHNWTPEEVALVQEISEQFALAAESLRLLDETQRRAARERLVAEITTKLRATNDPQTILQTAASELRTALKAKRTQVLLQSNPVEDTNPEPGKNERGEV